ncbi:hypothetical protein LJY25_18995 [Hymenobacter sp. BT175]|nr:hypothetical protein [Hymenobacter translucens]
MVYRIGSFVFTGLLLGACASDRCNPQQRNLSHGGHLYFKLVDARTGEPLWATDSAAPSRYVLDSARVFRGEERRWTIHDEARPGQLGIVVEGLERDSLPLKTGLAQRFLLWPTRSDADTIEVHYSLQENECGFREFRRIHVLYNRTTVYVDSGIIRIPTLTFRK